MVSGASAFILTRNWDEAVEKKLRPDIPKIKGGVAKFRRA